MCRTNAELAYIGIFFAEVTLCEGGLIYVSHQCRISLYRHIFFRGHAFLWRASAGVARDDEDCGRPGGRGVRRELFVRGASSMCRPNAELAYIGIFFSEVTLFCEGLQRGVARDDEDCGRPGGRGVRRELFVRGASSMCRPNAELAYIGIFFSEVTLFCEGLQRGWRGWGLWEAGRTRGTKGALCEGGLIYVSPQCRISLYRHIFFRGHAFLWRASAGVARDDEDCGRPGGRGVRRELFVRGASSMCRPNAELAYIGIFFSEVTLFCEGLQRGWRGTMRTVGGIPGIQWGGGYVIIRIALTQWSWMR